MGSWQHERDVSVYNGVLPDLTGLEAGLVHNGGNFSIKVVTNYGDKLEFTVLVGPTVGKVILHIYRNKSKMMSQGAKVLAGGMKASEVLARNLGNMLQEVASNQEKARLAEATRKRREDAKIKVEEEEERRQSKPKQQHMAQEHGRSMEHKEGRSELQQQHDINNAPTSKVHPNNIIREMQLKNTQLCVKLKERDAVLVKERQETENMKKKLTKKLKNKASALEKERLIRERLDKQLVDEREAWKKYCEDLERRLDESNSA